MSHRDKVLCQVLIVVSAVSLPSKFDTKCPSKFLEIGHHILQDTYANDEDRQFIVLPEFE